MDEREARRREAAARIDRWLAAVDRAVRKGFVTVARAEELPAGARAQSEFWCDEVLRPEANPHDREGARRGVHRAPDLLRHAYTARGLGLTVTEGRNFLLIEIDPRSLDLLALPPERRAEAVHRAAAAILRAPAPFQLPAEIGEGARFSTDDGAEPLLLSAWHRRVEGGVRRGRLYFLCYKKAGKMLGFAREERWLEGAAITSAGGRRPRRRPR